MMVKRSRLFLPAALVLTLVLAAPALAGGNANFVLGGRKLVDDNFWNSPIGGDLSSQDLFGVTVDFGRDSWPVRLETGVQGSQKVVTPFGTDFTGSITELFFGVNKTWSPAGARMHPYVGGGMASVTAKIEGGGSVTDDTSSALYIHGGAFWCVGHRFNLGVDVRALGGTRVTIAGLDTNANYRQAGLVLGWGWPKSK